MHNDSLKIILSYSLAIALFVSITTFSLAYGSTGFRSLDSILNLEDTISRLRFTRTMFAIFTGISLAIAGSLIQIATRNPLASPSILGLPSGALTSLLIAIIVSGYIPRGLSMLFAFIGALIAYSITSSIASIAGLSAASLVLAGIAVSSFFSGISHMLLYIAHSKIRGHPLLVLLGSVSLARFHELPLYTSAIIPIIATVFMLWKQINALLFGDEFALQLGYNPKITRLLLASIASLLSAITVSFVGIISFVGLIAPHIARLMVGDDVRKHLPLSMVSGGIIVLASDIFVRYISSSLSFLGELPLSIPTGIVGALVLSYLIASRLRD